MAEMTDRLGARSAQNYARLAAVLMVATVFAGGFGEAYAPSQLIVATSAAETAANLRSSPTMFRAGFAAYLIEALCDVALAWIFLILLRPVHRELALLAAFFGLVSTAIFGAGQIFYLGSSLFLRDDAYLKVFSLEQREALLLLWLKTCSLASGAFMVFYGITSLIRGCLMFQSGYFPKFIAVLFAAGGLGFMTRAFAVVLAPRLASSFFLLPMFVAVLSMIVWLFVRGIDAAKWEARQLAP